MEVASNNSDVVTDSVLILNTSYSGTFCLLKKNIIHILY